MNDDSISAAPAPAPEPDTSLLGSASAPAPAATPAPAPWTPPGGPPAPSAAPSPSATPAPSAAPAATPAPQPAPKAAAPETYADFKLPDTLKADKPFMGKFSAWAKENNLTQEAAQAAVDLAAEMQQGTATQIQATLTEFYKDIGGMPQTWADQAKADKEYGGEKFQENLGIAAAARDQFGSPALKALLNKMKVGDHPEVVRYFYRVGKAVSQDGFVQGRSTNGQAKTDAEVFYPTTH